MTLRLTPFERYMIAEDRPSYPMSFEYWLSCQGCLQREAIEQAFYLTLNQHPLASARLRRGMLRSLWQWGHDLEGMIQHHEQRSDAHVRLNRSPDLEKGHGVELHVISNSNTNTNNAQCTLIFNFHHAVCDGLGALAFIRTVLANYHRVASDRNGDDEQFRTDTGSNSDEARDFGRALERLKQRDRFVLPVPAPLTKAQVIKGMASEFGKVVFRRPQPIPASNPSEVSSADENNMCLRALSAEATRQLGEFARKEGATLNDVLVRDWFLTLRDWFGTHSTTSGKRWLRVLVPTNLRDPSMADLSCANVIGYAMLTRRLRDCDSEETLLQSIASDMTAVRDWGLGALFVTALAHIDRVPGLLKTICRRSKRFSTSLLSNIGNISRHFESEVPIENGRVRAGDLIVDRISAVPPVRPGTRVAMVAGRYQGCLDFAFRYDARWLARRDLEKLVDMYIERLESTGSKDTQRSGSEDEQVSDEGRMVNSPRGVTEQ